MPKVCCGAAGQPLIVAGVTSESMDLLVDWLYGHFKESLTFDQRIALCAVSHSFNILELQKECERVLSSSVTSKTYAHLALIATEFGGDQLKQARLTCCRCALRIDGIQLSAGC